MSLPPIVARVTAETSGLTKGLANAQTRLATFAKIGTAAAGAVAVGLVALTKASLANIDAMTKQARSLGLTTAAFQKMSLVAGEAGVSMGQLGQQLAFMQRAVENNSKAFGAMGIALADLQGLSPDKQFEKIAQSLNLITDPAEKTTLAMEVFGRSGRDAINMLDGYAEKLADAEAFQRRFGITVSQTTAEGIERANDAVGRLGQVFVGLGNMLAGWAAPAIEKVANGLINLAGAIWGVDESAEQAQARVQELTSAYIAVGEAALAAMRGSQSAAGGMQAAGEAAIEAAKKIAVLEGKYIDLAMAMALAMGNDVGASVGPNAGLATGANVELLRSGLNDYLGDNTFLSNPNAPKTRPRRPGVDSFPGSSSLGGGGGGLQDQLATRLQTLMEGLATEAEAVAEWYAESQATLEEALAAKLLTETEYMEARERLEQEHQDRLNSIAGTGANSRLEITTGLLGQLADLAKSGGKKMLGIYKASATAEAAVSGYQAAVDAWQKGMRAGGPGLAAAYAGLSLARTGALIAKINATNSGGGTGGTGGGGATAAQPAAPPVQRVLIDYAGPASFMPSIESLVGMMNEAGRRGYVLDARITGRG
jgi:hypothetical protein